MAFHKSVLHQLLNVNDKINNLRTRDVPHILRLSFY